MTDLERFCVTMGGEWRVDHYEMDGERLRVVYRSLIHPLVTWSHLPVDFESVAKVGTVGRIAFVAPPAAAWEL